MQNNILLLLDIVCFSCVWEAKRNPRLFISHVLLISSTMQDISNVLLVLSSDMARLSAAVCRQHVLSGCQGGREAPWRGVGVVEHLGGAPAPGAM